MRSIWKFKIGAIDDIVEMPVGATILSAAVQGQEVYIWAIVDVNAPTAKRIIRMFTTGSYIQTDGLEFVGTVFVDWLVFHVFDGGYVQ